MKVSLEFIRDREYGSQVSEFDCDEWDLQPVARYYAFKNVSYSNGTSVKELRVPIEDVIFEIL